MWSVFWCGSDTWTIKPSTLKIILEIPWIDKRTNDSMVKETDHQQLSSDPIRTNAKTSWFDHVERRNFAVALTWKIIT